MRWCAMNPPETIELAIESTAFGGRGVGRYEGKVCFVERALPGETVRARILRQAPNYTEARLQTVLSASPERVVPPCPYYEACNGCQYQHLSWPAQAREKHAQLRGLLRHLGGLVAAPETGFVAAPEPYGYRNTLTLQIEHRPRGPLQACFKRQDGSLLAVSKCLLASPAVNAGLAPALHDLVREYPERRLDRHSLVLKAAPSGRVGRWVFSPDKRWNWENGETLVYARGDKRLRYSCRTFFQTHFAMLDLLAGRLETLLEGAGGPQSRFFDLYAGVGTFSALLGDRFERSLLVEENPASAAWAKQNLERANARVVCGRAHQKFKALFAKEKGRSNVVFVNPPRGGCEPEMIRSLVVCSREIDRLLLLGCDPAVLVRDLKKLTTGGRWRIASLQAFDMFPQTPHFETLAELAPGRD